MVSQRCEGSSTRSYLPGSTLLAVIFWATSAVAFLTSSNISYRSLYRVTIPVTLLASVGVRYSYPIPTGELNDRRVWNFPEALSIFVTVKFG